MRRLHHLVVLVSVLSTSAALTTIAWHLTHDAYAAKSRSVPVNRVHEPRCERVVVDNLVAAPVERALRLEQARYLGPCRPSPAPIVV